MSKVDNIISNISKMVRKLDIAGAEHAREADFHSAQYDHHKVEAIRAQTMRAKIAELISV